MAECMTNYQKEPILNAVHTLEEEIAELKAELSYKTLLFNKRNAIGNSYVLGEDSPKIPELRKFRIGMYDLERLKKLPDFHERWEQSFYVTRQEEVENMIGTSLDIEILEKIVSKPMPIIFKEQKQTFSLTLDVVCILEGIVPTKANDYQLIITDPFATLLTEPIHDELIKEAAMQNLNKPVLMKLTFSKNVREPKCEKICTTLFHLI